MLRLLKIAILSSCFVYSADVLNENDIFLFLKDQLSSDKSHSFERVTLHSVKEVDYPSGWFAYFITLNIKVHNKSIELKDIIFSDGLSVVKDFTTIKDAKSLKNGFLENWDENVKGRN